MDHRVNDFFILNTITPKILSPLPAFSEKLPVINYLKNCDYKEVILHISHIRTFFKIQIKPAN